jgi:hypothetical protein
MRAFYQAIAYIKSTLENAPLLNTITHGTDIIDNVKKNIFPLAHINILSSSINNGVVNFTFEIAVVDIRNISKINVTDKFLGNDNELDNLNTCHAILNYMITQMRLQRSDEDIELQNDPTLQPILLAFTNALDGWKCDIEISVPNNDFTVCDFGD